MVHVLDTSPQGGDAGLRRVMAEVSDLARELSDLRATVGRYGAIYDRNGITIQNGGNIVGEGGGHLDWSGTAHFGGDTTIDGNLNLAAGIIGASALSEQASGTGVEDSSTSRPTGSWTTPVTATVEVPEWATRAFLFVVGRVHVRKNPAPVVSTINFQVGAESEWGVKEWDLEQTAYTTATDFNTATSTWAKAYQDPGSTIHCLLRFRATPSDGFIADPGNITTVGAMALFLR